jgi:DNA-binding winged helix-turn-helix (wHTH) protein
VQVGNSLLESLAEIPRFVASAIGSEKMVGMVTGQNTSLATRRPSLPIGMAATGFVRFRIGSFELNPKSGELINEDNTILLQSQPLKLLLMLIDRGGEMVTRREIQQRLWGNDVIVDFDHSMNTLVRKLSHALGDSVDGPTYIETLARRGYRLKVPVHLVEKARSDSAGTDGSISPWTALSAIWEDGDSAAPLQSSSLRLGETAGTTEHNVTVPRGVRCRRRAFYNPEQPRENVASMLGRLVAQPLCEYLITATPSEAVDALRQLLLLVTQVLEASSISGAGREAMSAAFWRTDGNQSAPR